MTDYDDERSTSGDLGPLAVALAKAQAGFGAVTRSRTVTVKTKTGGSYTFSYAPLDAILGIVREPLAKNGLAVTQLLDHGSLVTLLLHESGSYLTARTALPDTPDIQAYGSAVTYLRRYALQSLLGIAAEEDDDGNRGAGHLAAPAAHSADTVAQVRREELANGGGLIGTVEVGKPEAKTDYELRQTPHGYHLGFRLVSEKGGIKVVASDYLAEELATYKAEVVGKRVTCWGRIEDQEFTPKGARKPVTYQVLTLERIRVPDLGDLPSPPDEPDEAPSVPPFSEEEAEAIGAAVDAA